MTFETRREEKKVATTPGVIDWSASRFSGTPTALQKERRWHPARGAYRHEGHWSQIIGARY